MLVPHKPCLYHLKYGPQPGGVSGLVTDDAANNGSAQLAYKCSDVTSWFITTKHEVIPEKPFRFFVQQVSMDLGGLVAVQHCHIKEMVLMYTYTSEVNQKELQTQRSKILNVTQTLQSLYAYAAAQLSQVKP